MKKLEKLLPYALEAVENWHLENVRDPGVYNGYIASFGAGIIQSGLLPVIAMFSNSEKTQTGGDKSKIPAAVFYVLKKSGDTIESKNLFDYVLAQLKKDPSAYQGLCRKIIDASIAVKLALRTYKLK